MCAQTYLPEVEDEIKLADIAKECIKDLDKEMYSLKVRQLVVIRIDAGTEKQTSIASVDNLEIEELSEV